ncbi:MAG: hypothetical protein WBA28_09715 [Microbacteriaceae bacterium]
MTKRSKESGIVLGGSPKLNLLPPSHFEKIKTSSAISSVFVWVILAVVVAMLAIGAAWFFQNQKAEQLASLQQQNSVLEAERNNYPEVMEARKKLSEIALVQEAIPAPYDYAKLLTSIQASLPEAAEMVTTNVFLSEVSLPEQLIVNIELDTTAFVDAADYLAKLGQIDGFVRLEFNRAELVDPPYKNTLAVYFDAEAYLIAGGSR